MAIVLADVEEAALDEAIAQLSRSGAEVIGRLTDVRRLDDVYALADAAYARFGRVDLLCNNAGVFGGLAPTWTLDRRDWAWCLEVNLGGVINGIAAFVPRMVAAGRGHVLNTASVAGLGSFALAGPYCASKHAVVSLSETLAAEFAEAGLALGVTVMCPGTIPTRIQDSARNRPPEFMVEGRAAALATPTALQNDPELEMATAIRLTIAGVEANRLYVILGARTRAMARARAQTILAAIASPNDLDHCAD